MATPSTIPNFADDEVLEEIERELTEVIEADAVAEAGRFVINLQKLFNRPPNDQLRTTNPALYDHYMDLLAQAQLLTLPSRSEREAVDLFESHFFHGYTSIRTKINVEAKIHGLLVGTPGFIARDDVKRALRAALLRNRESFAEGTIEINGKTEPQTLGAWLRYYLSVVGAAPRQQALVRAEFFQRDQLVLKLAPEQRNVLREIVEFFEQISQSTLTPEGLEDRVTVVVDGKLQVYRNGFFEDLEKTDAAKIIRRLAELTAEPSKDVEEASPVAAIDHTPAEARRSDAIMAAYRGDPAKAQALLAEQQRLAPFVGTPGKLAAEFFAAVQRGKTLEVWAALLALASTGQLFDLLAQDEKLRTYLMAIWPKLYGPAATEAFARDPRSWQSIRLFLQYVLQERLRLPEAEAARIGAQVSNALQQATPGKYSAFAYYDVKTKAFRWMTSEAQK